jgi:hypothetical protein
VVNNDDSSALVVLKPPLITYTLPYLFQSLDTTTGPNKLAVCEPALVSALQYTDVGGEKGSHPNFPPFPLCRSFLTPFTVANIASMIADDERQSSTTFWDFPKAPNAAQAPQGYSKRIDNMIESENEKTQVIARWVSEDWTATITVPQTLVKTVSSGTMCCPLCIACLRQVSSRHFLHIFTFCVQKRRSDPSHGAGS